jgi:hypothetical protein
MFAIVGRTAEDAQRGTFGALEQIAVGALRQIGALQRSTSRAAGIAALGRSTALKCQRRSEL